MRVQPAPGGGPVPPKKTSASPVADEQPAPPYRFSLAGIQLKFSALAATRGGLTIPAGGVGGDWIVKLPSQTFSHVPENEWAMLHLAGAVGIPVMETRLVPLEDIAGLPTLGPLAKGQALAVKRFDRAAHGRRIHMEDFAQVYNLFPADKYGKVSYTNLANMVWTLTGETGLTDFIRRLVFSILIGNGDMHLKNWSFLYPDTHTPALTPAYDLVSTIPYLADDRLALTLSETKDMQAITQDHFKRLVKKAHVPSHLVLETAQDTVAATLAVWREQKKHYQLPAAIIERIDRHMLAVRLARKSS